MIVFSHIPKTAGTSFNTMLRRYFGSSLMAARYRANSGGTLYRYEDLKYDAKLYSNLKCLSGHGLKPFHHFKEFEQQMKWYTFLREPTSRFVSHYVHQRTSGNADFEIGLREWAGKFDRQNWCVRMIAGEEDVEAAKQILEEKFYFVGLVEEFATSVVRFCQCFDLPDFDSRIPKPKMVARSKAVKKEIECNLDQYRDLIAEQNFLDKKLYEFVHSRFWNGDASANVGRDIRTETPATPVRNVARHIAFELMDQAVL